MHSLFALYRRLKQYNVNKWKLTNKYSKKNFSRQKTELISFYFCDAILIWGGRLNYSESYEPSTYLFFLKVLWCVSICIARKQNFLQSYSWAGLGLNPYVSQLVAAQGLNLCDLFQTFLQCYLLQWMLGATYRWTLRISLLFIRKPRLTKMIFWSPSRFQSVWVKINYYFD